MRAEVLLDGRLAVAPVRPLVPTVGLLLALGRLVLTLPLVRPLPIVGRFDMLPVFLLLAPVPMRPDMLPAALLPLRPAPCGRWLIDPAVPPP